MAVPRLGVFKFASCDGCQLSFLALEDELVALAGKLDVAYFLEATSRVEPGPYDVALVEGSITTDDDVRRIREVRRDAKYLVTIGACATAGGIQALRNWADSAEFLRAVYARPEYIRSLATSTAIAAHVKVDFETSSCAVARSIKTNCARCWCRC
jgi:coenzyme F420-reducing hydrogenase gamma subunit